MTPLPNFVNIGRQSCMSWSLLSATLLTWQALNIESLHHTSYTRTHSAARHLDIKKARPRNLPPMEVLIPTLSKENLSREIQAARRITE
eukprot:scaffold2556_cov153-Skeletonema_menzelii.AAC.11